MNPATLCPRFLRCSVNNCPLDSAYPTLFVDPSDQEKSCPMEKNVRTRIANQFPPGVLQYSGLNVREYTARKRFEALPVALRNEMANRGREALKRQRNDKDGKIAS